MMRERGEVPEVDPIDMSIRTQRIVDKKQVWSDLLDAPIALRGEPTRTIIVFEYAGLQAELRQESLLYQIVFSTNQRLDSLPYPTGNNARNIILTHDILN